MNPWALQCGKRWERCRAVKALVYIWCRLTNLLHGTLVSASRCERPDSLAFNFCCYPIACERLAWRSTRLTEAGSKSDSECRQSSDVLTCLASPHLNRILRSHALSSLQEVSRQLRKCVPVASPIAAEASGRRCQIGDGLCFRSRLNIFKMFPLACSRRRNLANAIPLAKADSHAGRRLSLIHI